MQFKRLNREITAPKAKIMADDPAMAAEPEVARVVVKGGAAVGGGAGGAAARDPQIETENWKRATVTRK
jgi:hypothetical protein